MSDQFPPAPGPTDPAGSQPQPPAPGYSQAPGYPQAGYPQPGYPQPGYPAAPAKTPAIAVVGLVLAFLMPLVGAIVSIVALGKTKAVGAGRGLAKAGVIIGSILTVAAIGVVVALVVLVKNVAGPAITVTDLNDAVQKGDCQTFLDLTTDSFRSTVGVTDCDTFAQATEGNEDLDSSVTVTGTSITGDTATVTTDETQTVDGDKQTVSVEYDLVKQGGKWLVDSVVNQ